MLAALIGAFASAHAQPPQTKNDSQALPSPTSDAEIACGTPPALPCGESLASTPSRSPAGSVTDDAFKKYDDGTAGYIVGCLAASAAGVDSICGEVTKPALKKDFPIDGEEMAKDYLEKLGEQHAQKVWDYLNTPGATLPLDEKAQDPKGAKSPAGPPLLEINPHVSLKPLLGTRRPQSVQDADAAPPIKVARQESSAPADSASAFDRSVDASVKAFQGASVRSPVGPGNSSAFDRSVDASVKAFQGTSARSPVGPGNSSAFDSSVDESVTAYHAASTRSDSASSASNAHATQDINATRSRAATADSTKSLFKAVDQSVTVFDHEHPRAPEKSAPRAPAPPPAPPAAPEPSEVTPLHDFGPLLDETYALIARVERENERVEPTIKRDRPHVRGRPFNPPAYGAVPSASSVANPVFAPAASGSHALLAVPHCAGDITTIEGVNACNAALNQWQSSLSPPGTGGSSSPTAAAIPVSQLPPVNNTAAGSGPGTQSK
jgi:hypothetical protein